VQRILTPRLGIEYLSRVQHVVRIQHLFDFPHHFHAGWTGNFLQKSLLRQADAVLTGDGAAEINGGEKNFLEGFFDAMNLVAIALVGQASRVEIAVTEMAEVAMLRRPPAAPFSVYRPRRHLWQL
jgi:hypothetical protein